jgi:Histidine kinase
MSSKLKHVISHILCWAAFFFSINYILQLTFVGEGIVHGKMEQIIYHIAITRFLMTGMLFKISLFYFNTHFLLKRFIISRKIILYLVSFIPAAITAFYLEMYTVAYYNKLVDMVPGAGIKDYANRVSILLYILITGASLFYFFSTEWIKNEKAKQLMKEEQLSNELSLLKYQLNPHFLFNTLNNLFGMAQEAHNKQLSGGISKLAGLMRFMLYDSNVSKVLLDKEIAYLKDYIEIYKLRTNKDDDIAIDFVLEGDTSNKFIAPMLLIPFIENAFKHGINYRLQSFINIRIAVTGPALEFSVINIRTLTGLKMNRLVLDWPMSKSDWSLFILKTIIYK